MAFGLLAVGSCKSCRCPTCTQGILYKGRKLISLEEFAAVGNVGIG